MSAKICLNMIVKNESNIITRLFDSIVHVIDSYCICDTGSTDNTIEIIREYFDKKRIPGEIYFEPFQDFGYNRSFAIERCKEMENADYLLLLDADMIFQIDPKYVPTLKQKLLEHPVHYVFQGSETFYYKNVRFAKNNYGLSYWGVTHEYVQVPDGTTYGFFDRNDVFINDVGDGGSKQNKFIRDIDLLSKALEKTPNNDRYTFYLANSYRDSGQIEKAIETFKLRIQIGGWIEEVWHSYLSIGRCYKTLNKMEEAVHYWLEGYNYFPKRIENLYEIIEHYRNKGANNLAYEFYRIADRVRREHFQDDFLFLEKSIYDYKLDYEMSIIGYYCNPEKCDLAKISMRVLNHPNTETWMYQNILSNYKFYTSKLVELSEYPPLIYKASTIKEDIICNTHTSFISSTPSMVIHDNKLVFNIRYVNYSINEQGGYVQQEIIETKNVMFSMLLMNWYKEMRGNNRIEDNIFYSRGEIIQYNDLYDNSVYVGLEDMHLFSYQDKLLYTANRGLNYNQIVVESGEIDNIGKITKSEILHYPKKQNNIEKNWVLFENKQGELQCVYQWYPLTIGKMQLSDDEYSHMKCDNFSEYKSPDCFRQLRGSTSGVQVGNEIWFICHIVSYEDRRYYYHLLVALDCESYRVNRYSRLFTFEKQKVEYTLGFVYDKRKDIFSIGYSTMDNVTKFIMITKEKMQNLFIQNIND